MRYEHHMRVATSRRVVEPQPLKLKPCRKCGGTDIKIWECGYTTFNPGGIKCQNPKCGHAIEVKDCGIGGMPSVDERLARIWNADKPSVPELLGFEQAKTRKLRKQLREAGVKPCC